MAKKKSKSNNGLVLVGALVPPEFAEALKTLAEEQTRSVSNVLRKLVEDSPEVKEALQRKRAA